MTIWSLDRALIESIRRAQRCRRDRCLPYSRLICRCSMPANRRDHTVKEKEATTMSDTITFEPQMPKDAEAPKKRTGRKVLTYSAVGLTSLFVGMGIGSAAASGGSTSASGTPTPSTVTKTVEVPGPEVIKTVPGPEVTKTVEAAPAAPAASADPAGPKDNNQYLVGKEIAPGTWRCTEGTNLYWATKTQGGDIIDNDLHAGKGSLVANVTAKAYTVDLDRCDVPWVKIK